MTAVQYLVEHDMSLNKALNACEVSKQKRYWKKKTGKPKTDQSILDMVSAIRERRPFYGTRRVATELSQAAGKTDQPQGDTAPVPSDGLEQARTAQGGCQGALEAH